jgi:hypothetical protein
MVNTDHCPQIDIRCRYNAEATFPALQRADPNTTSFKDIGMFIDAASIQKIREWQQRYGGREPGKWKW